MSQMREILNTLSTLSEDLDAGAKSVNQMPGTHKMGKNTKTKHPASNFLVGGDEGEVPEDEVQLDETEWDEDDYEDDDIEHDIADKWRKGGPKDDSEYDDQDSKNPYAKYGMDDELNESDLSDDVFSRVEKISKSDNALPELQEYVLELANNPDTRNARDSIVANAYGHLKWILEQARSNPDYNINRALAQAAESGRSQFQTDESMEFNEPEEVPLYTGRSLGKAAHERRNKDRVERGLTPDDTLQSGMDRERKEFLMKSRGQEITDEGSVKDSLKKGAKWVKRGLQGWDGMTDHEYPHNSSDPTNIQDKFSKYSDEELDKSEKLHNGMQGGQAAKGTRHRFQQDSINREQRKRGKRDFKKYGDSRKMTETTLMDMLSKDKYQSKDEYEKELEEELFNEINDELTTGENGKYNLNDDEQIPAKPPEPAPSQKVETDGYDIKSAKIEKQLANLETSYPYLNREEQLVQFVLDTSSDLEKKLDDATSNIGDDESADMEEVDNKIETILGRLDDIEKSLNTSVNEDITPEDHAELQARYIEQLTSVKELLAGSGRMGKEEKEAIQQKLGKLMKAAKKYNLKGNMQSIKSDVPSETNPHFESDNNGFRKLIDMVK